MDTCGNTMKMDNKYSNKPVIPRDQVNNWSASLECAAPPSNSICPHCGSGWDISNWYDIKRTNCSKAVEGSHVGKTIQQLQDEMNGNGLGKEYHIHKSLQNDKLIDLTPDPEYKDSKYMKDFPTNKGGNKYVERDYVIEEGDNLFVTVFEYYHLECIAKQKENNEYNYFATIFDRAGYSKYDLTAIPNEYCNNPSCCPPWFNVNTDIGTFTIGWRKRVIKLTWPKNINALPLFNNENVTKESTYIHVEGTNKAVEYLKLIRNFVLEG